MKCFTAFSVPQYVISLLLTPNDTSSVTRHEPNRQKHAQETSGAITSSSVAFRLLFTGCVCRSVSRLKLSTAPGSQVYIRCQTVDPTPSDARNRPSTEIPRPARLLSLTQPVDHKVELGWRRREFAHRAANWSAANDS